MSDIDWFQGILKQGCTPFDLIYNSSFLRGTDFDVLKLVADEVRTHLADPQDPVRDLFHRRPNPDGSLGGWVQDGADIHPTVHIDPAALVFTRATLGKGTRVEGPSIVGPLTEARDSKIVASYVWGTSITDPHWVSRNTLSMVSEKYTHLNHAELSGALVGGTTVDRSRVELAYVSNSTIQGHSEVKGPDTALLFSLVRGASRVGAGIEARSARFTRGAVAEGNHLIADETVSDDRYALAPRPKAPSVFHRLAEAAHFFSRSPKSAEAHSEEKEAVVLRK